MEVKDPDIARKYGEVELFQKINSGAEEEGWYRDFYLGRQSFYENALAIGMRLNRRDSKKKKPRNTVEFCGTMADLECLILLDEFPFETGLYE